MEVCPTAECRVAGRSFVGFRWERLGERMAFLKGPVPGELNRFFQAVGYRFYSV